ncbi:hypothetical protein KPH14_011103 [Odynerus spinipes]|uniref:Rho-GAP domain-containing protein n=1 Tax=Odynerus spinipes TaxID=1348599 RepID=A0AAD9VM16_9HYME|nr:hypothetical protein KPH14_011103 [Odynerus spinipes]
MAERPGGRRRSRRDSMEAGSSVRGTPPASKDRRTKRSSKPSKERWLLTRKTWRYMADAGRRLIPDGTHNRPEDIPKIEQYFQEVCQKEPRFLLWRKASYPGTLGFRAQRRRRHVKGGSCRAKASSADEADEIRSPPQGFVLQTTTAGKFDLAKAKRDFFLASDSGGSTPSSPATRRRTAQEDAEAKALADMLQKYLNMQGDIGDTTKALDRTSVVSHIEGKQPFDYQSLIDKLQQHLDLIVAQGKREEVPNETLSGNRDNLPKSMSPYHGDYVHKSLMETLGRYYSKSPTRERVISDILTDRKLLEKLYFDLRCTRGFRGPRATGAYTSPSSRWWAHPRSRPTGKEGEDWYSERREPISPPPLIAVQEPSIDRGPLDDGVQTDPVPREVLDAILLEKEKEDTSKESSSQKTSGRRRSSVDNDDVSPSVSDTIKRYLRMARKKSMDADKVDRFKRVNYDRNLRNIKPKGEITKPGDDDGNNKGCQTDDNWAVNYREMSSMENPSENLSDADTTSPASRNASSRSSIDAGLGSEEPLTPKHHHQSFLSHLLHGSNAHKDKPHSAPGSPALTSSSKNSPGGTAMQKSKSSSSVVHHGSRLVAKKIWRSRSKSTSRASNQPSIWTPQGKCTWAGTGGRRVTLQDTSLRSLSEIERKVLCKVAVAKLQALNLGVHIRPPSESLGSGTVATKPKRRAYLLKRKALTTGFFESKGKEEKDKESPGGLVFGIPLSQCLENDRIARIAAGEAADVGSLTRSSRHGSRTSFTSLIEAPTVAAKTEDGGSCESLSSKGGGALTGSDSGVLELSDSGGGGTPGEWDAVPGIVRQCIRHLEATGLRTLGVFRVSPSKKRVRQLREDFDCGRETKIGPDQCPHDVAALLKEFFRDLPDPLLCRDLYQAFVHTQKIRNRRLQQEALQHLIQLLPTPNRETLWALLNFLTVVASNSEDQKSETGEWIPGNKMDTTNLATVFAPNILHCVKPGQTRPEVSAERAEERIDVINVVRALLEHASTLFTVPAALLDELYLHMMDTHPVELDLALSRRAEEQCGDEVDPCSEAETFSVEETLTTSGNTSTTTTAARKVWTREECLHQTAGVGGDIGPRPRRPKRPGTRRKEEGRSNSVDSGSSEDPADPRRRSSPMVITASLTIPMSGAFTLNLDDPDIPYIEETPKQPSAPPRRQRQRSISGCSEGGRHGSDSAVGSSATLSGDQAPSSPPSWASTPPASPDSAVTAVSYIPDQQAVLQRVSFTTSSEVRQVSRTSNPETNRSSAPPYTPSITSIGGAVLRSKTADIERMLHIGRPDVTSGNLQHSKSTTATTSITTTSSSDNKKYTKRRYTDSRHQTRHIPDSDTLAGKTTTMTVTSSMTMSSSSSSTSVTATQNQRGSTAQPVWKRRELISSAPKGREGYF